MPQERITALKVDETPVETDDVAEKASGIIEDAEAPPPTYPELNEIGRKIVKNMRLISLASFTRASSPVVPVPGVGQVGMGLQNTWGVEEEEEMEEFSSGDDDVEEVTKMEEQKKKDNKGDSSLCLKTKRVKNFTTFLYLSDDVVEISDSEEEEVVILHPEKPPKEK